MDRDVKHGCPDCLHYDKPTSKEPCKSCKRWSNWEYSGGTDKKNKG